MRAQLGEAVRFEEVVDVEGKVARVLELHLLAVPMTQLHGHQLLDALVARIEAQQDVQTAAAASPGSRRVPPGSRRAPAPPRFSGWDNRLRSSAPPWSRVTGRREVRRRRRVSATLLTPTRKGTQLRIYATHGASRKPAYTTITKPTGSRGADPRKTRENKLPIRLFCLNRPPARPQAAATANLQRQASATMPAPKASAVSWP